MNVALCDIQARRVRPRRAGARRADGGRGGRRGTVPRRTV